MNRFIVATGLVCGAAAPVGAQQIVGRTETSFSIKAAVAGGDWVRIASSPWIFQSRCGAGWIRPGSAAPLEKAAGGS